MRPRAPFAQLALFVRCGMPQLASALLASTLLAQAPPAPTDLRTRIETFSADLQDLERRYDQPMSNARRTRVRERLQQEAQELAALDPTPLPRDGQIDRLLLQNHVQRALHQLDQEAAQDAELTDLLPFAATVTALGEARRRLEDVDAEAAAGTVQELAVAVQKSRDQARAGEFDARPAAVLQRAAQRCTALQRALRAWFEFRDGYDPAFGWWVQSPWTAADQALGELGEALRQRGSKSGDASLVGNPIGAAALQRELAFEWIPYTPAELIAIAEREFLWCDAEMQKASRVLGCGDDWRAALEKVKQRHRAPGEQPALIRELAHEAIAFLEARDLVTIPPLAKECWRMSMMSRQAQRVNPFFLGGETIQVSFPTDAMSHPEKLQALRSNNEHFCRATVHHELIPGHWLQQYSQARHRQYRALFDTPFWIEGWALYWEMRLYDLGFAQGPEDRIGMLYWRKHRCARIVFSLHFHLGTWTGPQCVEYLIERVGHERAAAEGEVRRSVSGGYGPLYQAAYMLGGLQLRALHDELVTPGSAWTERRFHDEVLRQNSVPMAAVRAALRGDPVPQDLGGWRFADR